MSRILQSYQIPIALIELIRDAEDTVFLVTPYYDSWPQFDRILKEAANNGKEIVFVFRKDQRNKMVRLEKQLNGEYGFDVLYVDRLHTKLFWSYTKAIITSMNIYDSSRANNYELGYIINSARDIEDLRRSIIENELLTNVVDNLTKKGRYLDRLENEKNKPSFGSRLLGAIGKLGTPQANTPEEKVESNNQIVTQPKPQPQPQKRKKARKTDEGHCISCNTEIPPDPFRPYCYECFGKVNDKDNWYLLENYCLLCGNKNGSTRDKPFCYKCYKDWVAKQDDPDLFRNGMLAAQQNDRF